MKNKHSTKSAVNETSPTLPSQRDPSTPTPLVLTGADARAYMGDYQPLRKAADIALWLEISEWRVYELVRRDLIPHVKLNRSIRFDASAVKAWIASGGNEVPGGWRKGSQ